MIDLHCHSTASDGLLAPAAVVAVAARAGLAAIALTDHDTTAGLDEARTAGALLGVRVVGGCEFSVAAPWGEMHLLGYFIEPGDAEIEAVLTVARGDRVRRAREMVTRLVGLGIPITYDDVAAAAGDAAVGRPHVARALLARGQVQTIQQAFDRYIGRGRPAYIDKALPTLAETASLVHRKGGLVSAAHLKSFGTESNLRTMKGEGLDAVETRHPSHQGDYLATITDAAIAVGLLRTGGSDWHGESETEGSHAALGSMGVPDEWLDLLDANRPVIAVTS
ncbi:MAG TPA: PHP domain-containing protein [Gemmatimonadales bacterium]